MESQAAQKIERKLAKVDRKRWIMQVMSALQILAGPPFTTWTLYTIDHGERSVMSISIASVSLGWSAIGLVGLYAVTARRVQALVVFTSLEILIATLTSCFTAVLLLVHHLNCWTPMVAAQPTSSSATAPAPAIVISDVHTPWLRCPNITWLLAASAAMVFYLAATASEALSLRLRIQKTGKRNLNWNQKPTRWKERNVRRGASPALRAIVPHLKDGDSRVEEDARIKYLATHDRRYIHKSLLVRFDTLDDAGDQRRLLLNLRKGYFKHGELFGTKIYLSQITDVLLDETDMWQAQRAYQLAADAADAAAAPSASAAVAAAVAAGADPDPDAAVDAAESGAVHATRSVSFVDATVSGAGSLPSSGARDFEAAARYHRRRRYHLEGGEDEKRSAPVRMALLVSRTVERGRRWVRNALLASSDGADDPDAADLDESAGTLYSCIVYARSTTAQWKHVFGLSSRPRAVCLDFRRPDERDRFISFVEALLPPSITIHHAETSPAPSPTRIGGSDPARSHASGAPAALCAGLATGFAGGQPQQTAQQQQQQQATQQQGGRGGVNPSGAPAASLAAYRNGSCAAPVAGSAAAPPSPPARGSGLFRFPGTASSLSPQLQKDSMGGAVVPPLNAARAAPTAHLVPPMPGAPRGHPGGQAGKRRSETISIFVGSWNMGDAVAPALLDGWLPKEAEHDLYCIATQECSDEHWLMALDSHLGAAYVRVAERRMGGLTLIVFTHRRHAAKINGVETSFTPTGVLGVGTNKGAVALAFCIRGVRLCVVNAHLAAHQDKLLQRNKHVQEITKHLRLGTTSLELPMQYHTIWAGDLNYRIDETRQEVLRLAEQEQWHALHTRDQLAQELAADRVLFGFAEAPLSFPPTYKYVRMLQAAHRRRGFGKMSLRSRPSFPRTAASPEGKGRSGGEGQAAHASSPDKAAPSSGSKEQGSHRGFERSNFFSRRGFGGGGGEATSSGASHDAATPSSVGGGSDGGGGGGGGGTPSVNLAGSGTEGSPGGPGGGVGTRKYDEEKGRVPSWCDRVLWRSLPGPVALAATSASDCDDPHFFASDHSPVSTVLEVELPVLPIDLKLHHCTLYLSNLELYRAQPRKLAHTPGGCGGASTLGGTNLTARSAMGKGVPLPVAGAKLQNLPPQLSVHAHMLVLNKLLSEPPHHAAALNADGRSATNIVIGPMLAQREYLALQQLQLRVVSLSGGKPTELGQAVFALDAAAYGKPVDFDCTVERLTIPAGFNLRGTASIIYTKTLGEDHAVSDSARPLRSSALRPKPRSGASFTRAWGAPPSAANAASADMPNSEQLKQSV